MGQSFVVVCACAPSVKTGRLRATRRDDDNDDDDDGDDKNSNVAVRFDAPLLPTRFEKLVRDVRSNAIASFQCELAGRARVTSVMRRASWSIAQTAKRRRRKRASWPTRCGKTRR